MNHGIMGDDDKGIGKASCGGWDGLARRAPGPGSRYVGSIKLLSFTRKDFVIGPESFISA